MQQEFQKSALHLGKCRWAKEGVKPNAGLDLLRQKSFDSPARGSSPAYVENVVEKSCCFLKRTGKPAIKLLAFGYTHYKLPWKTW